MIRWGEISGSQHGDRFEAIGKALSHYKVVHEGRHFTPEKGEAFERALQEAQKECAALHFRHPFIHIHSVEGLPMTDLVNWIRARDALQKINGHWWPENHLYHSLPRFLTLYDLPVDFRGGGLILGAGGGGRTSVAALAHMGLKRITIIDTDDERAAEAAKSLRTHFWGASIESQSHLALTYLPGSYSVVINALSPEKESRLKSEISYFNFLYPSGIYMDLKSVSEVGLMEEASRVGARLVYGAQVTSMADAHWMKHAFDLDAPLKEIAAQLPQGRAATLEPQP